MCVLTHHIRASVGVAYAREPRADSDDRRYLTAEIHVH